MVPEPDLPSKAEKAPPPPRSLDAMEVAAIDLGSNSFHMVVARGHGAHLQIQDRIKEPVRLAAGLEGDGTLNAEAEERAIACLTRFRERLVGLPPARVRAVGTNTLRTARNSDEFLARAEAALGYPIEVISGTEEARLIYSGVAHRHAGRHRRLVVDIGGGSTEVVLGRGNRILRGHSLFMGCVSYSQRFFPTGKLSRAAFEAAQTAAELEISAVEGPLKDVGWSESLGASGSIGAVQDLLTQLGFTRGDIQLEAMSKLRKLMIDALQIDQLDLPGLALQRRDVLPGGLAILMGVFHRLGIDKMIRSDGALREGVLYDLLGRIHHHDVRDRTIRHQMTVMRIDVPQANRVARTALRLLAQVPPLAEDQEYIRKILEWASDLHEVGLLIAHTGYHKHGSYLVEHADLPGFSEHDRRLVATMIRLHRRKWAPEIIDLLPRSLRELATRLSLILRLSVLLCRSRKQVRPVPRFEALGDWKALRLVFPPGWLRRHPLTRADLSEESQRLRTIDRSLEIDESDR